MTTLVVAAHPDDEVLGCGGTIARLCAEGEEVHIAILGEGGTDREPKVVAALRRQVAKAAEHLGTPNVSHFTLPDQRFDTVPFLEITQMVEGLIALSRPDTVYTHHAGDLNLDHQITHRAVLTATRPIQGCPVRTIYSFETPSSTEWAFGTPAFAPNVFVGVTEEDLDRKMSAMAMYKSEVRDSPHPRSSHMLWVLSRWRGAQAGLEAAEAFQLVRQIRP